MHILTDYRLILGLSSERADTSGTALARTSSSSINYRPVLSSERALQNNKPATV
jgi:hypothetical protein